MRMRSSRFGKISWVLYIVPLALITVVLILSASFIRLSVEKYLTAQMAEHTEHISVNYMSRLANSSEASEIINDLINQKLRVAGRALASGNEFAHDEELAKLATAYEIDKIYVYNDKGEIRQSIDDEYLGWKAPIGHPVHGFMLSDQQFMVEDIRRDTESENYFKYAYAKADDGSFIQIGIAADSIHSMTEKFTIQYYLETLGSEAETQNVYFVDPDGLMVASEDENSITLNNDEIAAVRRQMAMVRRYSANNRDFHRSLVPVFVYNRYAGSLIIDYNLAEHNAVISTVYIAIFLIALVIFVVISTFTVNMVSRSRKLTEYAYFDNLTGLPNRYYLIESPEIISSIKAGNGAVLMLDIVNFRKLNMLAGRQVGDAVLKQLALKLRSIMPEQNLLFRLTEDRFIVCRQTYQDESELLELCNVIENISRISYSVLAENQPEIASSSEDSIAVKIGVLKLTAAHRDIDMIIKDLEILIEYLKSQPNISYGFFNETMRQNLEESEKIKQALRDVINHGGTSDTADFKLVFQPQVRTDTERVTRYEALARLNVKGIGPVSPPRFIELAERNQMIVEIGRLVLAKACEFLSELEQAGFSGVVVAINISAIELFHDNFSANLLRTIRRFDLKPVQIEIEVTETNLISNYSMIFDELRRLNSHGINIAIDDFGTGYSSLSRLSTMPVNFIKIDKFFIDSIADNSFSELMVDSIISIAHRLGISVVAEGVELLSQKEVLEKLGCDYLQGYYYSKPVSGNEIIEILRNKKEDI